jgi:tol-pal system protein YbgF
MKLLLHGASYFFISILFVTGLILSGCGTSVETAGAPGAPSDSLVDSLQASNQRLQDENAQLMKTNAQLDQDKKALNAKVADLTSKLGQSSSQWQDFQDLQVRVNTLDSELTVEKQINRDLSARSAESGKPSMGGPAAMKSSITSNAEFKKKYDAAVKLCLARKYKQAIPDLENLSASTVDDPLMSNAHYWLGMAYYFTKQYDKAVKELQKTITYPKSWKAADAYLELGMSYLRLGDKDNARSTWETLTQKYPKSKDAAQAKKYISQL